MNLTVTEVIEDDAERALLKGHDASGAVKTFHLVKDRSGHVDELVRLVRAGEQEVQVQI